MVLDEIWRMPEQQDSWIPFMEELAVVAADSTWSERALACNAGADTVARPGLAPLRWGRSYVLPEAEFEQVRKIDKMLGTYDSMMEVSRVETWALPDENHIKFGSAMEGFFPLRRARRRK